jgi:uncharacterized protein with NRDE domain
MCLIGLALDASRRFPLVVAANRDELVDRPASRLAWWSPEGGGPAILSGRDQLAGGTWLGLTAEGRLAMVTNVRKPVLQDPDAPSRGAIVARWLRGDLPAERYWPLTAMSGHQPFNLIAADFRAGDCFWASSEQACPQRIERGIVGLSNGSLDEPWTKVEHLKARMQQGLDAAGSVDDLAARLFAALADRTPAEDAHLPSTGIGRDRERLLSPAFIRTPDGRYGTRCSTLVITERVAKRMVTHVFERSFTPGPGLALLRRSTLKDWPPKYQLAGSNEPDLPAQVEPVAESELAEAHAEPVRKRRVRSLLRPAGKV